MWLVVTILDSTRNKLLVKDDRSIIHGFLKICEPRKTNIGEKMVTDILTS